MSLGLIQLILRTNSIIDSNIIQVDNTQKVADVNNDSVNDEELPAEIPKDNNINIEDDETTTEDEKQIEEIEAQTPIDSKPDSSEYLFNIHNYKTI